MMCSMQWKRRINVRWTYPCSICMKYFVGIFFINYLEWRGMECYNSFYETLQVNKGIYKRIKGDNVISIHKYNIHGLIISNLNYLICMLL
jgi:hypothetical protein